MMQLPIKYRLGALLRRLALALMACGACCAPAGEAVSREGQEGAPAGSGAAVFEFDYMADLHLYVAGDPERHLRDTAQYLLAHQPGAFLITGGCF